MLRVTKSGGIVAAREADVKTKCNWAEFLARANSPNSLQTL